VARLLASSSPPRRLASPHHPLEVSRSHIDISQEPSLSVRFVATRSPLSYSSASSHFNVSSVKSHKTSSPTSASSHPLSALFKSPSRLTSSPSLRTPTCAPSTRSVSLSSPRTSSLPAVSVASALKLFLGFEFWDHLDMIGLRIWLRSGGGIAVQI
jgi:hypothetical protein